MNSIHQTELSRNTTSGLFENLFRKKLIGRLKNIPSGRLFIEDSDEVHACGDNNKIGEITATIIIHDQGAYRDIALGGSLGAAEAYMQGKWTTPDLVALVRLMSINIDFLNQIDDSRFLPQRFTDKIYHWLNRNTQTQAKQNIAAHYDLSNEFFELFLDPTMMYSSAIFADAESSLDDAAVFKLDVICLKLELKPSDHLLEIGTGWGGLAIHAAKNYGCRVTTTTISKEQYEAANARVRQAGLEDRVTVLFEDYRNLQGRFDKLVSIEMIEAVGPQFYKEYFHGCSSLLKADGLMLLQSITIPAQRYEYALKSVDFIQRYIFPGGSLPSHEVILSSVKKHSDLEMVAMQEIGEDYAKTLEIWRQRFTSKLDQVRQLGFDDIFIRMWQYYLCYCQGAFEERVIGTSQILFAKPAWKSTTSNHA